MIQILVCFSRQINGDQVCIYGIYLQGGSFNRAGLLVEAGENVKS